MTRPLLPEIPAVDEQRAPIEVYLGDALLDFGVAAIPKLFSRFWIYLSSDGELLTDWEFAVLMQVLTLRDTQDYELRAENLPVRSKTITIERGKAKFRRMGLVFTRRVYYPPDGNSPPKMRAQQWDFRSLFYNLSQIGQSWLERQQQLLADWTVNGMKGPRPVFSFPDEYTFEISLPPDVAVDIVAGKFYPVPAKWQKQAKALVAELPTLLKRSGREASPSARFESGRQPGARITPGTPTVLDTRAGSSTVPETRAHLIKEDEEEDEKKELRDLQTLDQQVIDYFATKKGDLDYSPTTKERSILQGLLHDGYTIEAIKNAIDTAFSRTNPRYFTICAKIARETPCAQPEARPPEARIQPDPGQPEARNADDQTASLPVAVPVSTDGLRRAIQVISSRGREVDEDRLKRLSLMANFCDAAARAAGSSGADWVAEALERSLGVAQPESLLNYADAVIHDWVENGRPAAKKARKHTKVKQDENKGTRMAAQPRRAGKWPADIG